MKKISSKLSTKGIKRSGILRWFQKCVELLCQEVHKDLLSENCFFAQFSKSLKNQFFSKNFFLLPNSRFHIFEISTKFRFFDTLYAQFWRNFFSTRLRDSATFFGGLKVRRNHSIFQKTLFINYSLRISRPNQKHMKYIEFLKKSQNHWTLMNRAQAIYMLVKFILIILYIRVRTAKPL